MINVGEMCNPGGGPGPAKLMRQYHGGDLVVVEQRQGVTYPGGVVTGRLK